MPTLVDAIGANAGGAANFSSLVTPSHRTAAGVADARDGGDRIFSTLITTSVCLHLLFVGYLGYGGPADVRRPHTVPTAPLPPPIVENIQLDAPPPPKAQREVLRDDPPPSAPDLPAAVSAVSAVPASVDVAFGIKAVGPVRLVSDASLASGGEVAAIPAAPIEVQGRSLLTPILNYPPDALYRRYTGRVVVEFHTTATGDIVDAGIRISSGYDSLDRAALENLRSGQWVGEAGYFTKTYDFVLR
jgi:TonB family protein